MKQCQVIFRDYNDRESRSNVGYEGIFDDSGKLVLTTCIVKDFTEKELKLLSGDMYEDIAVGIALSEGLEPWQVVVCNEIDFELPTADEQKEAA